MSHESDGGCGDHLPEIETAAEEGKAHIPILRESKID
jgi:hypothetical protein